MALSRYQGTSTKGATVTINWAGTSVAATIYANAASAALSNPVTSSLINGSYSFWVEDGTYDITNGSPTGNLSSEKILSYLEPAPVASDIALTPYRSNTTLKTIQNWVNDRMNGLWSGGTVFPKTAGSGIKVDQNAPTYPWADMIGEVATRGVAGGATAPTYAVWQGSTYAFRFEHATAVQEAFNTYHLTHDYVMASNIYIHAHWDTIVTATGNVNWLFDLSYGKGYNQGASEGTVGSSLPVTVGVTQAGGTAFFGQIAEVVCSAAGGLIAETINVSITATAATLTSATALFSAADIGKTVQIVGAGAAGAVHNTTISAFGSSTSVTVADVAVTTVTSQPNFRWRVLDSSLFEPDGLISVRTWHQTNRAADTLTQIPFLHYVDCHYQSTGIGTKQRNGPTFWT